MNSIASRRPGRSRRLIAASCVGVLCILFIGMVLHAAISHDRTEAAMYRLLVEKGGVMLSSLEGGLRSSRGGGIMPRQDFLLEELAARPDVRFIAIVAPDGFILAHNNSARLGEPLNYKQHDLGVDELEDLQAGEKARWILADMEGASTFAVYKEVGRIRVPASRSIPGDEGRQQAYMHSIPLTLFVGLDPTPLFLAQEEDHQRIMLLAVGGAVCALLAFGALHWAVKARVSRQGQRAAEALTNRMVLSLPDGLILFDGQRLISHINDVACLWFRQDKPPLGKTAGEVLPPDLAALAERLFEEASLPDTELELPVNGSSIPLSVRGAPVEMPEEGRVGSIMMLRDLSERKALEAEIRRREKLAAVGNLAAGVAHEIRNPLSSIKGYATYFGARFPEGSDDREAARVMVGEVERLNRVITDLLEFSRPPTLMRTPTDLRLLAEDTLRLILKDATTANVRIRFEADGNMPLPLVSVDPDRMRQVLLNLCLNALDAMPDGGDLTLLLKTGDSHILLETHDTGTGIPPEVLPTIFDPYFTTKGHGTGLGLPTVLKIVEAHGGHILAESEPGHGATFKVFLPIRSPDGDLLTGNGSSPR